MQAGTVFCYFFLPLEMILHHRATTQRVGVSLPVGNGSDTT